MKGTGTGSVTNVEGDFSLANAFTEMNSNKAQQARMSLHERFSFLFMIRLIVNISF